MPARFEVQHDDEGDHYWVVLLGGNGEAILAGETHPVDSRHEARDLHTAVEAAEVAIHRYRQERRSW